MQPQQRRAAVGLELDDLEGKSVESAEAEAAAMASGESGEQEGVVEKAGEGQREEVKAEDPDDDSNDPDAWRQRLDLRAIECGDEGVELSAPPFPFQQYWDPQYQTKGARKRKREERSVARALKKRRGSPDYTLGRFG